MVGNLLGRGIRMFDQPGAQQLQLEKFCDIDAPGVAHLQLRIPELR